MTFVLLPVVCIILNYVFPDIAISIPAMSLEALIIYIMLQGEHETALKEREMVATVKAHHDELTGLLNRLAFNEACEAVEASQMVGVVFCDINGLKYTNDHYGHKAGDKLICDFTEILTACFRREEIFRISGDEFVILLPGITEGAFERRFSLLTKAIDDRDTPIAATGAVHGIGSELGRLIDEAEDRMYAKKKEHHELYPLYNRFI